MTKFKPKTRAMPYEEYEALMDRIMRCTAITRESAYLGLSWWMLDDDWLPTQSMAEARFILAENNYGYQMFIVDNAGDAILIERDYT